MADADEGAAEEEDFEDDYFDEVDNDNDDDDDGTEREAQHERDWHCREARRPVVLRICTQTRVSSG